MVIMHLYEASKYISSLWVSIFSFFPVEVLTFLLQYIFLREQ